MLVCIWILDLPKDLEIDVLTFVTSVSSIFLTGNIFEWILNVNENTFAELRPYCLVPFFNDRSTREFSGRNFTRFVVTACAILLSQASNVSS